MGTGYWNCHNIKKGLKMLTLYEINGLCENLSTTCVWLLWNHFSVPACFSLSPGSHLNDPGTSHLSLSL